MTIDNDWKREEEARRERNWDAAEKWKAIQQTITWAESQGPVQRNTPTARREEEARKLAWLRKRMLMDAEVVLYTRQGCHLCDDAKALLEKHGLAPHEVDIDQHPELRGQYNECVPVVVIDGRERFRGRVDEVLLKRLVQARDKSRD